MVFYFTPRGGEKGKDTWMLYMVRVQGSGRRSAAGRRRPPFGRVSELATVRSIQLIRSQGLDKYENEDLIKYSLPHDIWWVLARGQWVLAGGQWVLAGGRRCAWAAGACQAQHRGRGSTALLTPLAPSLPPRFHVDALSSAHVYLRLPEGALQRPRRRAQPGASSPPAACTPLPTLAVSHRLGPLLAAVLPIAAHRPPTLRRHHGRHLERHAGGRVPAGQGQLHPGGV